MNDYAAFLAAKSQSHTGSGFDPVTILCPPWPHACNQCDRGHYCARPPGHPGAHVCICWWRWAS